MSYDTKAQKNRPELQNGVALSTVLFDEEEETTTEEAQDQIQPPSASTANDAD